MSHIPLLFSALIIFLILAVEGTTFVSACHDNTPVVRNAVSGEWISNLAGHSGAVWSAKYDNSGTLIATGSFQLYFCPLNYFLND